MADALVFYATGKANHEGALNYWSYVPLEEDRNKRLQQLQDLVGGNVESLAPAPNMSPKLTAFANEDGLMLFAEEKEGMGRNDLAGGVLHLLGFASMFSPLGCAYAGTVVV